jgi:transposase
MEDVLDTYERPEDLKRPLICMDESPKQLIGEVHVPLPAEPGRPERFDTEYVRNGTCNLFMFTAPLLGWRRVDVTERRTQVDWAHQIKRLVDDDFPKAEKVVLVMDNLNTHRPASLYEAFEPSEAKRIWDRLEIHYTPKHGSWLNMAEIEFSVLNRHGLSDRVPDMESMRREVAAWSQRRTSEGGKIDWRFTTKDARVKLKRLYPRILH